MTHAQAQRIVQRLNLIGPAHGTVHGDFDWVRSVLERHADAVEALNALDPGRMEETPQGAAAHLGCREILEFMLSKGVKLDIFMACALGMAERVAALLGEAPGLANARGAHGIHILNHAADPRIVRLLLEHGADPNAVVYAPWGWTPLHEAAARGRRELVELLVGAGGDVGDTPVGTTPLHAAVRNGHAGVVRWLLYRRANPSARGLGGPWSGKTPLDVAHEQSYTEIAELLRHHGARSLVSREARP